VTVQLVDHHCHLDFPDFASDRAAYVARAVAAGVGTLMTISTRIANYDTYRAIAEAHDEVFFSVGTHPHQAHEELDVTAERIASLAQHPKCIAIGEAGLDYHYKKSPPEAQAQGLRTHIAAARLTGLPLEIHSRDADADMAAILEDEMAKGSFKAVLHCFTGGADLAQRAVALGLAVSFSGVITFKNSQALRDIARAVPMDHLLVETDAPFLAPEPHRGKRNEPALVVHTAAKLAGVHGVGLEEMARITTANFHRLYTKAPRRTDGSIAA
jgi:TatD DNase family protein